MSDIMSYSSRFANISKCMSFSQSGNAACDWAAVSMETAVEGYRLIAENVDCPTTDSEAMIDCLRTKDAVELQRQSLVRFELMFKDIVFNSGVFWAECLIIASKSRHSKINRRGFGV